jgi:uncharacterized protein (TIGR02466 family)
MKKTLDNLFATPVQLIDIENDDVCDFFANFIETLVNDSMEFSKFSSITTKDNLYEYEEFSPLVTLIKNQMNEYSRNVIGLSDDVLFLSAMWSNIRNSGTKHHVHQHPNSYLSGVLYLKVPESSQVGNIFFVDPRQAKNMMYGKYDKVTSMSERTWWYTPKKGAMILFPSWLEHGTDDFYSETDEKRISVSFNFMLTNCNSSTMSFDVRKGIENVK